MMLLGVRKRHIPVLGLGGRIMDATSSVMHFQSVGDGTKDLGGGYKDTSTEPRNDPLVGE